jgi:phage terminase small subunit
MPKVKTVKSLSDKQEVFCYEYIKDFNARQAAFRAGYSMADSVAGAHLMENKSIKAFIKILIDERITKLKITSEKLLENAASVAFSDINDFCYVEAQERTVVKKGKNGQPDTEETYVADVVRARPWYMQDTRPVQMLQQGDDSDVRFKLHDKLKALELLMKYKGLLKDGDSDGGFQSFLSFVNGRKAAKKAKA